MTGAACRPGAAARRLRGVAPTVRRSSRTRRASPAATSRTSEPRSGTAGAQPCTRSCTTVTKHQLTPCANSSGAVHGTALFDWRRPKRYETAILETWRQAHYAPSALYGLPYTVAEGLAATHGIGRARFLTGIAPKLTSAEQLRLQESAQRLEVDAIATDLGRMALARLAGYVLSLPRAERRQRRAELTVALRAAARRTAGADAGRWGHVVAVLDDSYSASGSGVKPRRPLAVALAVHYLLEALASRYTGLWLTHRGDPLLVHPIGPTGLGERILDGLEQRPERLVVVSDGWDNAPPGQAAEVLRVWRARLDPAGSTSVVHLNPVYDSDTFDVRRLAPGVASVGVRDAEDAAALVELSRFAAGDTPFEALRRHLAARVERFLGTPGDGS
jgi:hypothetical protein